MRTSSVSVQRSSLWVKLGGSQKAFLGGLKPTTAAAPVLVCARCAVERHQSVMSLASVLPRNVEL